MSGNNRTNYREKETEPIVWVAECECVSAHWFVFGCCHYSIARFTALFHFVFYLCHASFFRKKKKRRFRQKDKHCLPLHSSWTTKSIHTHERCSAVHTFNILNVSSKQLLCVRCQQKVFDTVCEYVHFRLSLLMGEGFSSFIHSMLFKYIGDDWFYWLIQYSGTYAMPAEICQANSVVVATVFIPMKLAAHRQPYCND